MAEFDDINQNINLRYTTNADDTAKEVVKLDDAQESVTRSTQANTKATKENDAVYKSMKTQVREATQEMYKMQQQYGSSSKEAIEATKRVAELKDQIGDASNLVDGFNPDRKFQSVATAINIAAVATSGYTSGMALLGAENAETEKTLLKVQAAMAFTDSIGRITELADDFNVLKAQVISTFTSLATARTADTVATELNTAANVQSTVAREAGAIAGTAMAGGLTLQTVATTAATIATNILNASLAVLLSPVTLVIAAIAGLVAGIAYLSGAIGDFSGEAAAAEKANLKLSNEIDSLTKSTKKANEETKFHNENQIAMAKASGQSTEAIRKLKEELINQEVAEKNLNVQKAKSIFLDARRIASSEDATDAQKETAKKAYEYFKEQNEAFDESLKARRQLNANNRIEVRQEQTNAQKELEEKQKEHLKKLQEDRDKAAKEALEKLKKDREETLKANEEYWKKYLELGTERTKTQIDNDKAFRDFDAETTASINADKLVKLKERADKEIEIEKIVAQQKEEVQESQNKLIDKGLGFLSVIAGKNKALQKAAIIAENAVGIGRSLIANAAGNAQAAAVAAPLLVNPVTAGPAAAALAASTLNNNIATGIGVASSIAATAKALSALGGGGSSGGGGGSTASSPTTSGTPNVGFQNSTENQIANQVTNGINTQEPVKAFVVSTEITTAQSLDRNKIEANSI